MSRASTGSGASGGQGAGLTSWRSSGAQERLWEGRQWFDESLKGYEFQQLLTWHANNHCGLKSRDTAEAVLVSDLPLRRTRLSVARSSRATRPGTPRSTSSTVMWLPFPRRSTKAKTSSSTLARSL